MAPGRRLIVGIGASAGGLDAFRAFLKSVPPDSGLAFVLVQHLSPDHRSLLVELLTKATTMRVVEAKDGMLVEPNRVFIIPPDSTLTIQKRRLQISRPAPPRERRRPIDTFFASLADDQGENAVCVVLAGTGSDGTLGLKAIKESGGLTLAQAEFDHTPLSGMPHSATATGLVDYVLPVEEMPAKLLEYRDHLLKVANRKDSDGTRADTSSEHLATITALLRVKIGHDFSKYKEKTLVRRVQRRMQVLQTDSVSAYIAQLRKDAREVELLFRELLIGVTEFFRDPAAFDALGTAIRALLDHKGPDETIRVWVPACATGEEAYSIAMLLKETMEQLGKAPKIQIFGTDIDDNAVAFARSGRYRKTTGVSPERLQHWFVEDGEEFCPVREIREMCVFSTHSVVRDPAFSKLDLISCRNLLIYMDPVLQERVLQTFHYALRANGILFLGPSEGVGHQSKQFPTLEKKHHIFRRSEGNTTVSPPPPLGYSIRPRVSGVPAIPAGEDQIEKSARRALAKYFPIYLVVDKRFNILRFSGGEAGRYLEPSSGEANLNLFGNLRKSLRTAVRSSLQTVLATTRGTHSEVVTKVDGKRVAVTVDVEPISEGGGEVAMFAVAFRERPLGAKDDHSAAGNEIEDGVRVIEQELQTTRVQLQSTIDELETLNEELKSSSEEYQSINEELQSSNEELETSKEEMQSINEELQTVNAELNAKNDVLTHLNSDLKNLLDSTRIATLFLDRALRIKNFTPGMTDIFHLRDGDRGRPITEIVTKLGYGDLKRDARKVLDELVTIEREVENRDIDATFLMRIRPYRTVDNVIDGVVITFVDISERMLAELARRTSEERFSAIVNQATVGVAETDLDGRFVLTNARYCQIVGRSAEELQRLRMQDIVRHDDQPRHAELLGRVISDATAFQIEMRYARADGAPIWVHSNVSPLLDQNGKTRHILAITLEIAERKHAEERTALLLGELDHRVKNILAVVSAVIAQTLKTSATPQAFVAAIEGRIAAIARAHSVLTKGAAGEATLRDLMATELAPYEREDRYFSMTGGDVWMTPRAGLSIAMAVHELASNAAKYGALSTPGGRLAISWTVDNSAKTLNLVWVETGGPPITTPPVQTGFGTTLIERTLAHEFDAVVRREFLRSGLRCTIDIPLTADIFRKVENDKRGRK